MCKVSDRGGEVRDHVPLLTCNHWNGEKWGGSLLKRERSVRKNLKKNGGVKKRRVRSRALQEKGNGFICEFVGRLDGRNKSGLTIRMQEWQGGKGHKLRGKSKSRTKRRLEREGTCEAA